MSFDRHRTFNKNWLGRCWSCSVSFRALVCLTRRPLERPRRPMARGRSAPRTPANRLATSSIDHPHPTLPVKSSRANQTSVITHMRSHERSHKLDQITSRFGSSESMVEARSCIRVVLSTARMWFRSRRMSLSSGRSSRRWRSRTSFLSVELSTTSRRRMCTARGVARYCGSPKMEGTLSWSQPS